MKKLIIPVTAALLTLAGSALAAEFQPMGALGIGGAGVARTTNAFAAYWNPAGLAFNEMAFSIPLNVSVGMRVSQGLADNVDRLSNFTEGSNGQSILDGLKNLNTAGSNPTAVTDLINLLAVIDDIKTQNGTLSVEGNAVVAIQIKHLAFGAFGTVEGFAQTLPDLVNVLPTSANGTTVSTPGGFYSSAGSPALTPGYTPKFFTDQQIQGIAGVFSNPQLTTNTISASQALALAQTIDQQMASNPKPTGLSNTTIFNSVTTTLNSQLVASNSNSGAANTNTINNNQTAVLVKSFAYIEYPLAYGHPFNLGSFGMLGIGATVKVVQGRVYQSRIQLIESGSGVQSPDILQNLSNNFEESVGVTADLGALWRYNEWLNVGIVAKNLTSPSFTSPTLKNLNGEFVDKNGKVVTDPIRDEPVKLKPQVRMGVALSPLSWLTVAADLDLTNNETVLTGLGFKSRTLGGGLEVHPFTWLKVRGGMYTNLSNSEIGPVATAGLTFGSRWVNLEVDGAYGLETAQYNGDTYPKEARAQANLNIQF